MKTIIYMVRHGAYDSPTPVVPYRLPGFHLSEHGKEQTRSLARAFTHENITAVYTSPMERTQETADILARPHDVTPIIDARLNEVRSPAQGKTKDYIDSFGGWLIYASSWYTTLQGESLQEIFARISGFVEEKKTVHVGQSIIVVSHGDPIMLYAAYCQGIALSPESLARMPYVPMSGGYRLELEDNGRAQVKPIVI